MGGRRLRAWIVAATLAAILVPSAALAWQWRSMPHLGAWHDDAVYVVSAKSLAVGGGYRLLNLPGEPAQTKYPPLYPLMLSLVWRIAPQFPANAPLLMLVQWSMLPAMTALLWAWFRMTGFGMAVAIALTAAVALCPMTAIFATAPLTEIPFLIAVLGCLVAVGDGTALSTKRAVLSGVCAAAAVMIRSTSVVLAAAIPMAAWRMDGRARLRRVAAFLAPVATAFAAWEIWCGHVRRAPASDLLSYYTDYAGFYKRTFSIANLPHRLWINIDGLLTSIGGLVAWSAGAGPIYHELCWFLSLAAIGGWLELWRRGRRGEAWFAILFSGLLVVWNFPPDQRLAYPLLPFALAGLAAIAGKILVRLPSEWRTGRLPNRIVATVMGAGIAALVTGIFLLDVHAWHRTLPAYMIEQRDRFESTLPVYAWIARETPAGSIVAAYDDPLLYLYTARHAVSVAVLPSLGYEADDRRLAAYVQSAVREWNRSGVSYVVMTPFDFRREFQAPARDAESSELPKGWRPVLLTASGTVWARNVHP